MEELGSHWTNFHDIRHLRIFSKTCRENSSFIKILQEWRVTYFTWRPMYIFVAELFLEWEMFQTKVVEKIKTHILCSVTFIRKSCVCEIMWKNMVERGRPQMTIWRMRIACRVTKTSIFLVSGIINAGFYFVLIIIIIIIIITGVKMCQNQ